MNGKRFYVALLMLCILSIMVRADIPPRAGYSRVNPSLALEIEMDIPAIRFFLVSNAALEEIKLTKGEVKSISSERRRGTASSAKLLAIPQSSMNGYGEELSAEDLKALKAAIKEDKISDVRELLTHSFQRTVPSGEKSKYSVQKYLIKVDPEKGLVALPVNNSASNKKVSQVESTDETENSRLPNMVGGGFLSLSFLFLGIWLARKKPQQF